VFTGICRRRRKQNPTISPSTAQSTWNFKELKLRGLAFTLKRKSCMQLPWPCFLASQEMGVELELKTQAAIKPNPAK
jgi:hypothetical protein